jgi:hypothetical protein
MDPELSTAIAGAKMTCLAAEVDGWAVHMVRRGR